MWFSARELWRAGTTRDGGHADPWTSAALFGSETATVWVETDAPAEVDVLGRRARTFHVSGHHYALVVVDDCSPAPSRRTKSWWMEASPGR